MHVCVECSPDLSFRELPEVKAAGRLQILMSQNFFDVPNRAPALQKIRCSCMSQDMGCNALTGALEHWPVGASEHRLRTGNFESQAIHACK